VKLFFRSEGIFVLLYSCSVEPLAQSIIHIPTHILICYAGVDIAPIGHRKIAEGIEYTVIKDSLWMAEVSQSIKWTIKFLKKYRVGTVRFDTGNKSPTLLPS